MSDFSFSPSRFRLPGYRILASLSLGKRSHVYRAVREADGCAVVLKMPALDAGVLKDLSGLRREYRLLRQLDDLPGVIRCYGLEEYAHVPILILEDFGGKSLRLFPNPLAVDLFLSVAIAVSEILAQLHNRQILHKDITPGNILYNAETQTVKLIDFEISTCLTRENPQVKSPNALEGTLAYIAPEQTGRMNRSLDHRADLYSLGATFYELLTGQLPFETQDLLELVHCHMAQPPIAPKQLQPTVPEVLSNIILKLMAKNPEDRYQSALGLRADLVRCQQEAQLAVQIPLFALGEWDAIDRFQIPQKLYGRQSELEQLLAAFERVTALPTAGVTELVAELMLIAGYAGIGKSSLVLELYKPITAKRGYFIAGKYDQVQRHVPYSAVVEALSGLLRQVLGEPEAVLAQWRDRLQTALGDQAQAIVAVLPELALILGSQPALPELEDRAAQNRFHRVFQTFLQALCSPTQPLTLFLDDLQWADGGSLLLLERLLTETQIPGLFLIGAYRDHEVEAGHPLQLLLNKLAQSGVQVTQLVLGALRLSDVAELLADSLSSTPNSVQSLAALVFQKTGGNPFFVNTLLTTLYTEHLLNFDQATGRWLWDMVAIQRLAIADNVVDVMLGQLRKLPEATQAALRVGACVGANFDLQTLTMVCDRSARDLFAALNPALQRGLLQAVQSPDEDLLVQQFRFEHDRIQQAAYELLPPSEQQRLHWQIGQSRRQRWSQETTPQDYLFDWVDHLNLGWSCCPASERLMLAELNLQAAQRAQAGMATAAVADYAQRGIALLPEDAWANHYNLTVALHLLAAGTTAGDQQSHYLQAILTHSDRIVDRARASEIHMQALMAQNQQLEAWGCAESFLAPLGITFPAEPQTADVQQALQETTAQLDAVLQGRSPLALLDLPTMSQPEARAKLRMLAGAFSCAFQAVPGVFPILVCHQVNLSLQYGNGPASAFAYATYGLLCCGIVNDSYRGYQFGKLALRLLEQPLAKPVQTRTLQIVYSFLTHWQEPLRDTVEPLWQAYQTGLNTGDWEYAAYCLAVHCLHGFWSGQHLTELAQRMADCTAAIAKLHQSTAYNYHTVYHQLVEQLRRDEFPQPHGSADPYQLRGPIYDETQMRSRHEAAADKTALFYLDFNKAWFAYLFNEADFNPTVSPLIDAATDAANARSHPSRAETWINQARDSLNGVTGTYSAPIFYCYDALIALSGDWSQLSPTEQSQRLERVATAQNNLQTWATAAPDNFAPRWALIEAERLRVLGDRLAAMDAYDTAIAQAKQARSLPLTAQAYERAALFYNHLNKPKIAQTYREDAYLNYILWGCRAKVLQLETYYPELQNLGDRYILSPLTETKSQTDIISTGGSHYFASASRTNPAGSSPTYDRRSSPPSSTLTSSSGNTTNLDLVALLRASQSLASTVVLEDLLINFMGILLENAGAQVGYLILIRQEELWIEAVGGFPANTALRLQPVATCSNLAQSVIHYVLRTRKSVVLDDAFSNEQFGNDPYIQDQRCRSLLCSPLLNQGQLLGIMYLENNLAAGVFTQQRLEILEILATQAAIAIENARLYEQMATLNQAYERFVPREFLEFLSRKSITEVQLGDSVEGEMSILFADIRGFTTLSEQMSPSENFKFINSYLSLMEPAIVNHHGFIDKYVGDGIMAIFPREPSDAVNAGIEMLNRLREYNHNRGQMGRVPIRLGIGINTGRLMLGTVGGTRRMDGTVIGDAVNLASRLEGLTKTYGVSLIAAQNTVIGLDRQVHDIRLLDRVQVKGKAEEVDVFEIFDADPELQRELKRSLRPLFEQAIALYQACDFEAAQQVFSDYLARYPSDRVVQLYLERCEERTCSL